MNIKTVDASTQTDTITNSEPFQDIDLTDDDTVYSDFDEEMCFVLDMQVDYTEYK